MSKTGIVSFYDKGYPADSVDKLKFFLMPFVMFVLFGFPTQFGIYVKMFSNFAAPAFFILCGFFVLCPNEQKRASRIKRALKRSFWFFIILFVLYAAISIAYLIYNGVDWLPSVLNKRVIFEFLVMNIWPRAFPTGTSIWFIQSLFYAYIFFFIADKIKMLRFYLPLMIVFFLIMILTGEFSSFTGFPYYSYTFIPGGAVTRAIPYMLLGMLIRKNAGRLLNIRPWLYIVFFIAGLAIAISEYLLLSHFSRLTCAGHFIGLGIMAFSICCFALSNPGSHKNFISTHGRNYAKRIYALCQPVSMGLSLFLINVAPHHFGYIIRYQSIIVFFLALAISVIIGLIKYEILRKKRPKEPKENA